MNSPLLAPPAPGHAALPGPLREVARHVPAEISVVATEACTATGSPAALEFFRDHAGLRHAAGVACDAAGYLSLFPIRADDPQPDFLSPRDAALAVVRRLQLLAAAPPDLPAHHYLADMPAPLRAFAAALPGVGLLVEGTAATDWHPAYLIVMRAPARPGATPDTYHRALVSCDDDGALRVTRAAWMNPNPIANAPICLTTEAAVAAALFVLGLSGVEPAAAMLAGGPASLEIGRDRSLDVPYALRRFLASLPAGALSQSWEHGGPLAGTKVVISPPLDHDHWCIRFTRGELRAAVTYHPGSIILGVHDGRNGGLDTDSPAESLQAVKAAAWIARHLTAALAPPAPELPPRPELLRQVERLLPAGVSALSCPPTGDAPWRIVLSRDGGGCGNRPVIAVHEGLLYVRCVEFGEAPGYWPGPVGDAFALPFDAANRACTVMATRPLGGVPAGAADSPLWRRLFAALPETMLHETHWLRLEDEWVVHVYRHNVGHVRVTHKDGAIVFGLTDLAKRPGAALDEPDVCEVVNSDNAASWVGKRTGYRLRVFDDMMKQWLVDAQAVGAPWPGRPLEDAVRLAYQKARDRGWDRIYWMIDLHDTAIQATYDNGGVMENGITYLRGAVETLTFLLTLPETRIILWSSMSPELLAHHRDVMFGDVDVEGIVYLNENPEEGDTEYACFHQKPYFNVLLDDKAGFDPAQDWAAVTRAVVRHRTALRAEPVEIISDADRDEILRDLVAAGERAQLDAAAGYVDVPEPIELGDFLVPLDVPPEPDLTAGAVLLAAAEQVVDLARRDAKPMLSMVTKLFEEGGELATEVNIAEGHLPHKEASPDGILGEAADVVQNALCIAAAAMPDLSPRDFIAAFALKLAAKNGKWASIMIEKETAA